MEVILVLVALGLAAYWVYSTSQKRKEESKAVEASEVRAPYKVESPVLATPVVEEPVKIIVQEPLVVAEATPATVEVTPVKKPRAKKAPAAKTAAKPKAAAATAKPKAKKPTIKIAK